MDKQMGLFKIQNGDGVFTKIEPITDTINERIKELVDKVNKLEERTDCKREIVLNVFRFEGSESLNAL